MIKNVSTEELINELKSRGYYTELLYSRKDVRNIFDYFELSDEFVTDEAIDELVYDSVPFTDLMHSISEDVAYGVRLSAS